MVVRFLVGRFFDIVSQMKGHVGGGSGSWRLSGVGIQINLGRSYMSRYIPLEYIVQEWLLKMSGF